MLAMTSQGVALSRGAASFATTRGRRPPTLMKAANRSTLAAFANGPLKKTDLSALFQRPPNIRVVAIFVISTGPRHAHCLRATFRLLQRAL